MRQFLNNQDLIGLIHCLGLADGQLGDAARIAQRNLPGFLKTKADVGATQVSDMTGSYINAINSLFLPAIEDGRGVFNPVSQAGRKAEFYTPLYTGSSPIIGEVVGEAAGIPLIRYSRDAQGLVPKKVAAGAVFTNESLRTPQGAEGAIRELSDGLILARDISFCTDLISGADYSAAAILDPVAGLKALIDSVNLSGFGEFFWAESPAVANFFATVRGDGGNFIFPDATPKGGMILGIPALVTRCLNNLDSLLLIDARRIVTGSTAVEIKISSSAAIEMSDAPAVNSSTPVSPTGKVVSLFQTESSCLLGILSFAFKLMKATGVGVLTDLSAAWAIGTGEES